MRAAILMIALAACGSDDPSPHDRVPCAMATQGDLWPNHATECSRACASFTVTAGMTGPSCTGHCEGGAPCAGDATCPNTFVLDDGSTGCCLQGGSAAVFFECQ